MITSFVDFLISAVFLIILLYWFRFVPSGQGWQKSPLGVSLLGPLHART